MSSAASDPSGGAEQGGIAYMEVAAGGEIATEGFAGRRMSVGIVIWSVVLLVVMVCAIAGSLIAPQDPSAIDPTAVLQHPSGAHLLGTDQLGRDVLSRVIAGARSALLGPLLVAAVAVIVSTIVALLVGFFGGLGDTITGRVVDFLYALPQLIVVIVLVGLFGGGYWMALGVLVVFGIPRDLRLVRAAVIERRNLPYIEAALTLGVSRRKILFSHMFPNILPTAVTCFFLAFTYGIIALASLSFLGLGVAPGSPDWGRMVAEGRAQLFTNPWPTLAPCIALILSVLSVNFVGDWMFERLQERMASR